jgi:protein TonB
MTLSPLVEGYHLKSDLARVCLPNPQGHSRRTLAWVNSICFLFLLIGILGARNTLPKVKKVAPLEEAIPILIQPEAPTPPPQAKEERPREQTDDTSAAPRVVAVTVDTPAINFSVPAIGNVVVPNAIAAAPPAAPLRTVAPANHEPTSIGDTGQGGDRPAPSYPEMAAKFGQQGTVVLLLTVKNSGVVQSVTIKETSGSPLLDRSAKDFVKRHWIVPPGPGGRVFQVSIVYKL